jgi:DNA-binding GntR family transcriptional regulator
MVARPVSAPSGSNRAQRPAGRRADAGQKPKDGLEVAPLNRDTLQERVYTQIADLILDGAVAPGQQVTIRTFAKAFGVSAMPVREALKRLSAANALRVGPGRSMGIPPLSIERLTDLRNVRLEVEGTAAAWAASRISTKQIAAIEVERKRMDQAVSRGNTREFLRANRAFHFGIYSATGSPTMLKLIESLWLQISPYFNLLGSGNYTFANVQHYATVKALKRRDGEMARAAIRSDIEGSCDVLLTRIK